MRDVPPDRALYVGDPFSESAFDPRAVLRGERGHPVQIVQLDQASLLRRLLLLQLVIDRLGCLPRRDSLN